MVECLAFNPGGGISPLDLMAYQDSRMPENTCGGLRYFARGPRLWRKSQPWAFTLHSCRRLCHRDHRPRTPKAYVASAAFMLPDDALDSEESPKLFALIGVESEIARRHANCEFDL